MERYTIKPVTIRYVNTRPKFEDLLPYVQALVFAVLCLLFVF